MLSRVPSIFLLLLGGSLSLIQSTASEKGSQLSMRAAIARFGAKAHSPEAKQGFPWDQDYDEESLPSTPTTPSPATASSSKPRPSTQAPLFPWEADYPDESELGSSPATTAATPATSEAVDESASELFPWDVDYPDASSPAATMLPPSVTPPPVIRPTPPQTTTYSPFPWEDDYPQPTGTPSTSTGGQTLAPGRPPLTLMPVDKPTTATPAANGATFVYFPFPTDASWLASVNASLQANLPCSSGSLAERLQCLGQLLLSFG